MLGMRDHLKAAPLRSPESAVAVLKARLAGSEHGNRESEPRPPAPRRYGSSGTSLSGTPAAVSWRAGARGASSSLVSFCISSNIAGAICWAVSEGVSPGSLTTAKFITSLSSLTIRQRSSSSGSSASRPSVPLHHVVKRPPAGRQPTRHSIAPAWLEVVTARRLLGREPKGAAPCQIGAQFLLVQRSAIAPFWRVRLDDVFSTHSIPKCQLHVSPQARFVAADSFEVTSCASPAASKRKRRASTSCASSVSR